MLNLQNEPKRRLFRKFEDPEGGAVIGRVLDLGDERRPGDGVRATVADDDRDVLLAVDGVGDGAGARHVVQARFPKHFAVRFVVSANIPIE